jgi:hypothetical protein
MGRLDRFLRLERSRPRRAAAEPVLGAGERFEHAAPAVGSEAVEPAATGMDAARFGPAAPPAAEKPIAVLADDGGQPFIRCRNCRTDNHLTAITCAFCEANLTTPPQRAYNEALWRRHSADNAEMQRHVQALNASREQAEEEARQAIRRSLAFELNPAGQEPEGEPPLGVRLARRIRDPRLRLAVLVAVGTVPLYLVFFGSSINARFIGYFMALAVGVLFRPRSLRRWLRGGTFTVRLR